MILDTQLTGQSHQSSLQPLEVIVTTRGFLESKENSLFVFLQLNILCLESRTKTLVFAPLSVSQC